jgi:hydrogenase nickel incorporation protein HypA/HybF
VHELSIALSLVDAACEAAAPLGNVRVEALHVRLGALSGVVKEALAFSFAIAASGTRIDGARLDIEEVAVTAYCPQCDAERTLDAASFALRCPVCDGPLTKLIHGREMELTALEVSDEQAADRRGPSERPQEE